MSDASPGNIDQYSGNTIDPEINRSAGGKTDVNSSYQKIPVVIICQIDQAAEIASGLVPHLQKRQSIHGAGDPTYSYLDLNSSAETRFSTVSNCQQRDWAAPATDMPRQFSLFSMSSTEASICLAIHNRSSTYMVLKREISIDEWEALNRLSQGETIRRIDGRAVQRLTEIGALRSRGGEIKLSYAAMQLLIERSARICRARNGDSKTWCN
ncbi:hypothetical protein FHS21_002734 [Phyllobacterium trifolii]|uniref:Uncharacterized protein n=1 Tax=Phyllobacterium trifolii TaxID=300193 RepID=A0A839UD44_9HYPH|nr:hypothetical protein [Phyllobacterium trifolii]MBB3146319.1 hypothetical protein [Phyllobacterium trifolii]